MKKFINLIYAAALVLTLATGCSDDDKYEVVDPSANIVKIVSRETTLPAAASQGKIVVEADAPVTVTSTADGWLTTTVNGNTILLDAEFNPSLESRSANLTIKSGTKVSQVAVIQEGVIVDLDLGGMTSISLTSDDAKEFEVSLTANCDAEFNSDVDWITISENTESRAANSKVIMISVAENNSGRIRTGNVTYKVGPVEGQIPVSQYEFAKDIAGEYEFHYYTGSTKATEKTLKSTLTEKNGTYLCHVVYSSTIEFDIPLTFDTENCSFKMFSGQAVGTLDGNQAYIILGGQNYEGTSSYYNVSESISMDGILNYTDTEMQIEFVDNGSWSNRIAKYFSIRTYDTTPISGAGIKNYTGSLWFPFLKRTF